jgi:hypothetical protein
MPQGESVLPYRQKMLASDLERIQDLGALELLVLLEDGVSLETIGCKLSDGPINPAPCYLRQRFTDLDTYQISAFGEEDYETPDRVRVCPALVYLEQLVQARMQGGLVVLPPP